MSAELANRPFQAGHALAGFGRFQIGCDLIDGFAEKPATLPVGPWG